MKSLGQERVTVLCDMPMLKFVQKEVAKYCGKPVEVLISIELELSAMSGSVLCHVDFKGVSESGAVLAFSRFQMFDEQFFDEVFVNIDTSNRNAFFDVCAQVRALSNLDFMCHLFDQKLLSLSNRIIEFL